MNIEEIREYCISKKAVTESFPFDNKALVFKVANKMFALLDLSVNKHGLSLKCDPELAIQLREQFKDVTAAYHFNKKHWNGIDLSGNIPNQLIKDWVDHSYDIVVKSLTKANRQMFQL